MSKKFQSFKVLLILGVIAAILLGFLVLRADGKKSVGNGNGAPERQVPYKCPASAWIDCMPGPGPKRPQCQPNYIEWAQKNCPGFEGVAY